MTGSRLPYKYKNYILKISSRRAVSLKKATGMEEFYLASEHFGGTFNIKRSDLQIR